MGDKRNQSKIRAMKMDFWRRYRRLIKRDTVEHEQIRQQTKTDIAITETTGLNRLK